MRDLNEDRPSSGNLPVDDLSITLIQRNLDWEDIAANKAGFEREFERIEGPTDLVVLPEMFSTGFTMNASELAEPHHSGTFEWMRLWAQKLNAVVTGSIIVSENGSFFNRLYWVRPDGQSAHYDKRHLFTLAGEEKVFTAGSEQLVQECRGWNIRPVICYDLRFPVWLRQTAKPDASVDLDQTPQNLAQNKGYSDQTPELSTGYDLLVVVANWPEKRSYAWRTLLRARAIENMAWVAAVNRVGIDGNNMPYNGGGALIDPLGQSVLEQANEVSTNTVTASAEMLNKTRSRLGFLNDADGFSIKI